MRLGYAELEAVVRATHGAGAKPTALLGRLRYIQGLDWPPGGARGQGSRAGYGLEQVVGVALAFELLELGMSPVRAVRLLRSSWDVALRAIIIGWASGGRGARPVLLALAPRALDELGLEDDAGRVLPDALVPIRAQAIADWAGDFAGGTPSLYLVDPRRIAASLRSELVELGVASNDAIDQEFLTFGTRLFGVDEPSIWEFRAAPRSR